MDILSILAKKRDGLELSKEEIAFFIKGCADGSIADYQSSAFLMAGRINGFTREETLAMTLCMEHSGELIDLSDIEGIKVDKHSTGGVGDKVSLILMPILAAAGLKAAKMSGRGLGHTGGTLDKLESIPGFCCEKSIEGFKQQIRDIGIAIISQNADLVPADKKLYALRDVTSTVDSIPLITASIMSKKLATGAQVLLLDVKCGNGALISDIEGCRSLARSMVDVGRDAGIKTVAAITDMSQPLGTAVGNALEVREALDVLENKGFAVLRDAVLELAAACLIAAGVCAYHKQAWELAEYQLTSGKAYQCFAAMVRAQGGDDDFTKLPQAGIVDTLVAERDGYLSEMQTRQFGVAAMELGAGRMKLDDVIDPAAGLIIRKHLNDRVSRGDVLVELHTDRPETLTTAKALLHESIVISDVEVVPPPHIYEIIG